MRLIELYHTTSFRLALVFLGLFSLTSLALFTFIDIEVSHFLTDKVDEWVLREGRARSSLDPATIARQLANRQQREDLGTERPMALYGPDGQWVAGSTMPLPAGHDGATQPFEFRSGTEPHRLPFRGLTWRLPSEHTLLIAQNINEVHEFNEVLFNAILFAGVFAGLFGLAGAMIVGIGTVRRLDAITFATRRIVAGDLSGRLPNDNATGDVGRLVGLVNDMLGEIERLMHEVKGVCDNIAHDLRTPLTRLLAGLERVRRRSTSVDHYADGVDEAIGETRGVLKTFNALLRISEVEDGARRAGFVAVDIENVIKDVVEFYQPLAEEKEVALVFDPQSEHLRPIPGDPSLLFEAFANLVDNAIKFTPCGGKVAVRISRNNEDCTICVEDTGPGIPAEDRASVFRRFYRAEPSRHEPGNGLGLSLVAAVARLHGMEVGIENVPGCKITFRRVGAS